MKRNYIVGKAYFEFGYYDDKFNYPDITTFVYIGKNICGDEEEELWYFQDPGSYIKYGPFTGKEMEINEVKDKDLENASQIMTYGIEMLPHILSVDEFLEEVTDYYNGRSKNT